MGKRLLIVGRWIPYLYLLISNAITGVYFLKLFLSASSTNLETNGFFRLMYLFVSVVCYCNIKLVTISASKFGIRHPSDSGSLPLPVKSVQYDENWPNVCYNKRKTIYRILVLRRRKSIAPREQPVLHSKYAFRCLMPVAFLNTCVNLICSFQYDLLKI